MKRRSGDGPGALAAYEEGLAIARELAGDKSNAEAQTDVVVSLFKLAQAGEEAEGHLTEALALLRDLDARARLSPDKKGWIAIVSDALKKLDPP